jgi:DHHA2 domain
MRYTNVLPKLLQLKMVPRGKATVYDAAAFSLLLPISSFSDPAARSHIWSAVSMLLPKFLPSSLITPALFEDELNTSLTPSHIPPLERKGSIATARDAARGSRPSVSEAREGDSAETEGGARENEVAAANDVLLQAEPESDLRPSAGVTQVLTDERISEIASVTAACWKALAAAKSSVVHTLGAADMLQRDCKIVTVPSPLQPDRPLQVAFATIPTSLSALVYGHGKPAFIYPPDEREKVWDAFWAALSSFLVENELDVLLCLMSSRQGASQSNPKRKHVREM